VVQHGGGTYVYIPKETFIEHDCMYVMHTAQSMLTLMMWRCFTGGRGEGVCPVAERTEGYHCQEGGKRYGERRDDGGLTVA